MPQPQNFIEEFTEKVVFYKEGPASEPCLSCVRVMSRGDASEDVFNAYLALCVIDMSQANICSASIRTVAIPAFRSLIAQI